MRHMLKAADKADHPTIPLAGPERAVRAGHVEDLVTTFQESNLPQGSTGSWFELRDASS